MKKIIAATLIAIVLPAGAALADNAVSRGFDQGLKAVESGVSTVFSGIGDFYDALDSGLEHKSIVESAIKG